MQIMILFLINLVFSVLAQIYFSIVERTDGGASVRSITKRGVKREIKEKNLFSSFLLILSISEVCVHRVNNLKIKHYNFAEFFLSFSTVFCDGTI